MEYTVVDVKENVGTGTLKVKIISRYKLSDTTVRLVKDMTLDEVRKYGKLKAWTVLVMND